MADVFISYAREDQARAEQVARGLEAMGLAVFWDTEIPPGQTWADYIEGKLAACKSVIVLWSQHSTKSQWVREEARMGRERAKLIPAILDGSPMPFGFGEVQAADLSTWSGQADHPQWRRMAQAVYSAVRGDDAVMPTPAPQAAQQQQQYTPPPPPPQQAQPLYAPAYTPSAPASANTGATTAAASGTLSPIGYIQKCFQLYANGKGRARRSEYGWWIAFQFVATLGAYLIDMSMGGINPYTNMPSSQIVSTVLGLALLAPSVSVMSRRLHDLGVSGWLVAAIFGVYVVGFAISATGTPAIGSLIVLAMGVVVLGLVFVPGKPGENQYGPNPKGV